MEMGRPLAPYDRRMAVRNIHQGPGRPLGPMAVRSTLESHTPAEIRETDASFLVPLTRIERVPYSGPVYNLEVEDPDHSYVAPFLAVTGPEVRSDRSLDPRRGGRDRHHSGQCRHRFYPAPVL